MTGSGSGRLVGRTHHFPVRVYYADTDAGGMVYHATFLVYAERARTEMMRLGGLDHIELKERHGLMLGVRACALEFFRAARLDDRLEFRSTLEQLGGASMRLRQEVWRDDVEIARIEVRLACLSIDGRAARIPDALHRMIHEYLVEEAV